MPDEMSSIQCFLPTGLLIDVKVRLLDEIFTIKKNVIQAATTDGKKRNVLLEMMKWPSTMETYLFQIKYHSVVAWTQTPRVTLFHLYLKRYILNDGIMYSQ